MVDVALEEAEGVPPELDGKTGNLIASGVSLDKVGGILFQSGPPEALEKDVAHLLGTQMEGEFRGMGPWNL